MGGPLALPPTAIRRVNAGLIVGNPVGSSGTRAKALTSAELKAIIEASGISYLPLSGGTLTGALSIGENALTCGAITAAGNVQPEATATRSLGGSARRWSNVHSVLFTVNAISTIGANGSAQTIDIVTPPAGMRVGLSSGAVNGVIRCGAITTSGNLAIRDGLTAMQAEVFRTFTSDTSFESLCLKATASAMQIGSAKGSVGGTSRPVQLGHFDSAGTFTSAINVAIDGAISMPGAVTMSGSVALGVGSSVTWSTRGSLRLIASNQFRFTSSDASTGFVLSSATNNQLTVLSLDGSTAGNLSCGAITSAGNLAIRNGLNAMTAEVFGTFTSDTSFESLSLKTTASAMQIGSAIGSAGGTNRPLQLGHFDADGNFTARMQVLTAGNISCGGNAFSCGAFTPSSVTASSDLTFQPSSSRTLATNGQFSVEMTSNTAGNLVYRGSDGTTRRNPQVFYPSGEMQRTLVHAPTWSTYTPAGAATATLLLSDTGSNLHRVTRPTTGNITIAFSGDSANQLFLLVLQTSGSGTPGTVTWPSGITWLTDSGAAPTISTAIDKTDSIMFQRTGSGTYLGWHTGKN